jgi:hypothetical protein
VRIFSEEQKRVLEILLNQYEKSKTYRGENKVAQTFEVAPEKIFAGYDSDYADMNRVRDFENQMKELEDGGFITVKRDKTVIKKLAANPERWQEYYGILKRQERRTLQRLQAELYQGYLGEDVLLDRFCREQIARLQANKKPAYEREEAGDILKLCRFILKNQKDILERELSIAVLGDSKRWEKKYRAKVCSILKKYGGFDGLLLGISDGEDKDDRREMEKILLAEYHVYSNPSYVHFKGNAEFLFMDGQRIRMNHHMPAAFSTEALRYLESVRILDEQVMTVENLTSFNRMNEEKVFLIFLSGYHNSAKQKLIRKIYDANPGIGWRHFGDIDPDGFYIIENLRRGTGIDFRPVYMDAGVLERYLAYTKPLTQRDRTKAQTLLSREMYAEAVRYMLATGRKLEQEIVSWMEAKERNKTAHEYPVHI